MGTFKVEYTDGSSVVVDSVCFEIEGTSILFFDSEDEDATAFFVALGVRSLTRTNFDGEE